MNNEVPAEMKFSNIRAINDVKLEIIWDNAD
jgi:hypothetical protein